MKKRMLLLGAGVMQGPALRIARELGFATVAVDGNPAAPHSGDADWFYQIDLKDTDALLALALSLQNEEAGLAGVFTAGTDFSAPVAYIAEKLGLPGIPYETALDASDKERMRRRFAACGVPSPAFTTVSTWEDGWTLPFAFPVVVKPVDNMGARGCRLAETMDDLHEAVCAALPFSRTSRVIIEEYMDGPEFSVDALVYQGDITICGLAARHIFYPPYFIEMGHTMSAELCQADEKALLDVFIAGIRALGIKNGAAKGDIKLSSKGAMIGEIAARLSGGYMSGWTYPYASGVEPARGALRIAAGLPPGDMTPLRNWVSAERAFISIPGTAARVVGLDDAKKIAGVKDVFLRVSAGDAVLFPVNNVSKCGNVISAAASRDVAVFAAEEAARQLLIQLKVPDAATDCFLAETLDASFPPPAFAVSAEVRSALEALPETAPSGLTLRPFPLFTESAYTDYAGRTVQKNLDAVRRLTGLALEEDAQGALGRGFWRAMIRGAYQGAAYYLERRRPGILAP